MDHYLTRAELCQLIAERSFYEDIRAELLREGFDLYRVTEDVTYTEATWSEPEGLQFSEKVKDHTRLMDPAEYVKEGDFIEHHFGELLDSQESGEFNAITFSYLVVDEECDWPEEDCEADHLIGWCLVAV